MAKSIFLLVSPAYYTGYCLHAYSEAPIHYCGEDYPDRDERDQIVIEVQDDWVVFVEKVGTNRDISAGCGSQFSPASEAPANAIPLSEFLERWRA